MTFLKKHYIALLLGFAVPSFAMAAGLGRMTVQSALGQPLRAEIEVVALQPGEADTLAAALAPVASFRQSNIDYSSALQAIRFSIERRPNSQFVIALSSSEPMNEPFLDMLIELTWSAGRLVREYTFLLDPLELKPTVTAPTPPVAPPVVAPLAPEQPSPVAAPSPAPAVTTDNRPAPASAAAARPAARPAAKPSGQYEVKRGDTLARIASQNMVAGATLQQMLAALYRGNEDAFDGKNMNRLRTGKILNLPAAEDVQSVTQNEAIQLVRSRASEYADYKRTIGAAVAAAPERAAGSRQASGKITAPAAEQPAAKGAPKDQVRLSKPDDVKAGGKNAATAAADDAAAKDKALREAQERVALLEKNVQDLQKLVQLKSGAGAQAQKQAEAVKGAEAKAESAKAAPAPAPAAKADAAKAPAEPAKGAPEPAKAAEAPKAAAPEPVKPAEPEAGKAAEAPKPAAEGGAAPDTAKAAPKPAAKAPPPPPPPDLVDQILDNDLALGGAGAVVVLLGGYAFYAWRKKKQAASAEFGDSVASESPAPAAPSIASSAMADSEPVSASGESGGGSSGGGDEIDPVAEADVYMAYGRDTQAEEILKEALSKDVNRTPVWLKLLEVYANRKDLATFESTAKDLHSLTGGQGPDWEKAQALGLQLDPANSLYGGSGAAADVLDLGSTQVMSGADLAAASDATVIPDAVTDAEPAGQAAVDFDLDLGDAPAEESGSGGIDLDLGAPAPEAGSDAAMESTGSGLDFDLGLGGDQPAAETPSEFSPQGTLIMDSTALPATETVSAPDEGGASIDFDLGMPGEPPAGAPSEQPVEAAPVVTEDSGSTMDFNLNLDDAPALPEAPAEEASPATTDIDLSALSLDLGTDDAVASAAPMDAKWQEVATKLDLAKAYDEMGDKEGARDLLNEVMQEGDAAQKQQAKTMIDALG